MGRLSRLLGRRRRERTAPASDQAEMVAGFPTRRPSPWGDELELDEDETELRRRHGFGTNYLVIDQFGAAGSGQL